jgi:hypothetical protein
VLLGVLLALALLPVAAAAAAPPSVTITSPANGNVTNNPTPAISGTAEGLLEAEIEAPGTLKIYGGAQPNPVGTPLQELEFPALGGTWAVSVAKALPDGQYTLQAVVSEGLQEVTSAPVIFTVDATPPQLSMTSPAQGSTAIGGSQVLAGAAGTAAGDLPVVTVQLFAGSSIGSQAAIEAVTVPASGGSWSATLGGLGPGTYTARAEQGDEAGNVGFSEAVTFTLLAPVPPPSPAPPHASFTWFPTTPVVGESVSLASSSTDQTSALATFAWALGPGTAFTLGKQVLTTSFATPGAHVVRLRVTAADGLSSLATATVNVISRPLTLMAPFPVVRIGGVLTSYGVNLSTITAQAPPGALVRVTCRGRHCPRASETRLAVSSGKRKAGMVLLVFRRFERSLSAGVTLQIRIFKPGQIGKYTRFTIRHGRLPMRVDSCVDPTGTTPIPCPTS